MTRWNNAPPQREKPPCCNASKPCARTTRLAASRLSGWRGLRTGRGAKRVFQSPGPIYEPEGHGRAYWSMAGAIFAAGLRAGDLAHGRFS